ncbi:peptidylprolyl isomerase [Sabulicella glaciei]|uniref:Parvulin-like PPIase n=1 Tax=Sabulicella glaciei TaxID=2984948 RepID=A0ABT3NPN8_9PROT|nr:peptidylprolyl isomerase [Roseococcus sp. MDT2-1-1]MCW8084120.1 peptidylprolyl isomerase [Roseococcus sp. MDT2-1-1]
MLRVAASSLALLALMAGPAPAQTRGAAPRAVEAPGATNRILAVVNGDVVTQAEVASRARLFALNSGVPVQPETLARLQPQVLRLLIDEKLRLQEVQRQRIAVTDNDIAEAVREIESRNGLPSGALRAQLRGAGVQPRVLYDQIRVQIGWGRLLRVALGPQAEVSEAEVRDAVAEHEARRGQTEYLVGEIFIPVDDPRVESEVRGFTEDVIGQLRRGSPFPVVATQFSQAQSALQGGDLGWVVPRELDSEVASIIERMPPGAVSNPIRVPGGYQIVTLRAKREAGSEQRSTMISVRQLFLPFATRLDPQNPTEQHRQMLERAQRLSSTLRGCEAMEQQPRTSDRPADPGPLRLEGLNPPPLRQMLASLPIGRASQPVISNDGILLLMVCEREQREAPRFTAEQARGQILRERVEVISRQLLRDLRRRAIIETRG